MAQSMWMLQNSQYKMFVLSEQDAREWRRKSPLLRFARVQRVLQMRPDEIEFNKLYPRYA